MQNEGETTNLPNFIGYWEAQSETYTSLPHLEKFFYLLLSLVSWLIGVFL